MRIKGYLSKERFSMRQVIGLLAVVFVGVAVFSYAGVSIPYTFTAGTTAKASEVNANFQALANAMPAVKTTYLNEKVITSTTGEQLNSIQVALPAAGQVLVNATGIACISKHQTGYEDQLFVQISKAAGTVDIFQTNSLRYATDAAFIDDLEVNYIDRCNPFSINDVFNESSAGTITYYLNGSKKTNSPSSGIEFKVMGASFTALYVPNTL